MSSNTELIYKVIGALILLFAGILLSYHNYLTKKIELLESEIDSLRIDICGINEMLLGHEKIINRIKKNDTYL